MILGKKNKSIKNLPIPSVKLTKINIETDKPIDDQEQHKDTNKFVD